MRMVITTMHLEDFQKVVVAELLKDLKQHIKPDMTKGGKATARVFVGTPFLEIIREVLKNKHDLVMKKAGGKGSFKEIFI